MENRVAPERRDRPGMALAAFAVILAITAAWWALALWPAGACEPLWLTRTRAACFGSNRSGLPDAGGWVLLVGEPLGMLGVLIAVWGRSLQRDYEWLRARRAARVGAIVVASLTVVAAASAGVRVGRIRAASRSPADVGGVIRRIGRPAPTVSLVDQHGTPTSFGDLRGRTVLLTFAYGHCSSVCPSTVSDLKSARRTANQPAVVLVVVTLDPWRDTPERLPTLAQHWGVGPGDRVLSGSVAEVEQALNRLGVGRTRNPTTGDIDHAAVALVIDERGTLVWRMEGGVRGIVDLIRNSR